MSTFQKFRRTHLLALLEGYDQQKAPIDFYVSRYFREHAQLGSKDRAAIAEEVYCLIRWKGLIDYFVPEHTWPMRLEWLEGHNPNAFLQRAEVPLHVRLSLPEVLLNELIASWGQDKAVAIAQTCLQSAPTCIRANRLKIARDDLLIRLQEQNYQVSAGLEACCAIYFHKKENFFCLKEFREGLFEVQDEGSQLVADMVRPQKGDQVLDFCAGSGGKALAFAANLFGTGQIFLHDVRKHALIEAKKRLKRAGIQNAQIVASDDVARLKKLKKAMDWVLVDAPCSGTGTLRRNPDMKWKFTLEMLERLVSSQRVIFEKALSFVKAQGYIVYATCSVLARENRQQVEHFLNTYPSLELKQVFECCPERGKKDGFFSALFQKKTQ